MCGIHVLLTLTAERLRLSERFRNGGWSSLIFFGRLAMRLDTKYSATTQGCHSAVHTGTEGTCRDFIPSNIGGLQRRPWSARLIREVCLLLVDACNSNSEKCRVLPWPSVKLSVSFYLECRPQDRDGTIRVIPGRGFSTLGAGLPPFGSFAEKRVSLGSWSL